MEVPVNGAPLRQGEHEASSGGSPEAEKGKVTRDLEPRYSVLFEAGLSTNILDKVIGRLKDLANEELESRIGRSGECNEIERLDIADTWELILIQARDQLAKFEIDIESFEYDLAANPAIVCLVELVRLFDRSECFRRDSRKGAWLYFIEQEYQKIYPIVASWLVRREEAQQRSARSGKGATARASRQREIISDAIHRFDPGQGSGKSKRSRAEIIRKLAQAAKARGQFPEADRLPRRLDKYLI